MSDVNPYSPPVSSGNVESSSIAWSTDGSGLLVKHATVLPEVDLGTGERETGMKCTRREYHAIAFPKICFFLVCGAAFYLAGIPYFGGVVLPTAIVAAGLFVYEWIRSLRGRGNQAVVFWEYVAGTRRARQARRRKIVVGILVAVIVVLFLNPLLTPPSSPHYMETVVGNLVGGVILILATSVWAFRSQRSTRITAGPPGWVRLFPVHPEALEHLKNLEQARQQLIDARPDQRKRLVFTRYYHRFPCRLLIASGQNPILSLRILLMKVLRSKHLEKQLFHPCEATPASSVELCEPLRNAIHSWLEIQPDWSFVRGSMLTSPDGGLITHDVCLVSQDFSHDVCICVIWSGIQGVTATTEYCFSSWLADGSVVLTFGQPFLDLALAGHECHRADGTLDHMFRQHLHNCGQRETVPAGDPGTFADRRKRLGEAMENRLVELGYQSATREES